MHTISFSEALNNGTFMVRFEAASYFHFANVTPNFDILKQNFLKFITFFCFGTHLTNFKTPNLGSGSVAALG